MINQKYKYKDLEFNPYGIANNPTHSISTKVKSLRDTLEKVLISHPTG